MILIKRDKFATISDAAAALGVNVQKMRSWLSAQVLPAPSTVAHGSGHVMVFSEEYLNRARAALRRRRSTRAVSRARTKGRRKGAALKIFVSYSHKDTPWLKELTISLAPLVRAENVDPWDDGRLKPGSKWRDEINAALNNANSAILLVSRYFVASEYISKHELQPILKAAKERGLLVLWIAVTAALTENIGLEEFQALNDPKRPLRSVPAYKRDKEWVEIAKKINQLAGGR